MDFELTQDQADLRQLARDFVAREVRPVARDWEHQGRYPAELIDRMKELGLFGMTIPEEFGGSDADAVSCAVVIEELARGWVGISGTLGAHLLASRLIARSGTSDQKREWLPDLATGKSHAAFALTEPGAGSDLRGIAATARKTGDHYALRGSKTWITAARHATHFTVLAKIGQAGYAVLVVERDTPGFTISKDIPKLGFKGTDSCELVFDDAQVPVSNLLGGSEHEGLRQVTAALQLGRINVAGTSVGIAQESYELGLTYALQRRAFGHHISEFQAIQLKLAEMATQIQAARLLVWWAAKAVDTGNRSDTESSMAKTFASETALACSLTSMRIHGGYSISTEFDIERYYRDAPVMAIGEGTNDVLRLLIARNLLAARQ